MPFADHRAIRVRRAGGFSFTGFPFPSQAPSPSSGGDGDNNGNNGNGGAGQQPPTPSTSPTPSPSAAIPPPSHTRHTKGDGLSTTSAVDTSTPTTSSETPSATIISSSATTSSAAPTSTSVSVVVIPSSTKSTTFKSTPVAATAKAVNTFATGNGDLNTPMTTAPGPTVSSSNTAVAATGNLNVGAVIGGVAGGIAGIALFFYICMFFIRRRRESNDQFDPMSFRKSAVMIDETADPFNPRPPTMIQRKLNSHNVAPSISSFQGPNMAGAGAYTNNGEDQQYGTQQYDAQQYMQQPSSQSYVHQPIQPRQHYTFGQAYNQQTNEQHGSDNGHGMEYDGPYSSEPRAQDIYAAEAYAYPGEGDVIVSPGMQAQEMGHHQEYQEQTHDAYGGM